MGDIIEQAERIAAEYLRRQAEERREELRRIQEREGNVY